MPPEIAQKIDAFFTPYPQRRYSKGEILVQAGDNPTVIYYLLRGSVRQYDIGENGDEVVVNVFLPPAFFPMSYALNRHVNEYFFEAAETIDVREASPDASVTFLEQNPDVALNLLKRVYSGTDGILRRLAHLMGGTARNRLIFELIISCRRFGKPGLKGSHFLGIRESELATRAGLTRETVNRTLHELKAEGLVRTAHGGLQITDLMKLEEILGSNL